MKEKILIKVLNDGSTMHEYVELATTCSCCGVALHPDVLFTACIESDDEQDNVIFSLNYCPNCNECFVSKHIFDEETGEGYIYYSSAPIKNANLQFSRKIEELSPDFVSIYRDSYLAESHGLTSICGMGYRKALEFLIKDYVVYKNPLPEIKDHVVKLSLMQCINKYIEDKRLITLASASAWLGNDETHYVKKHPSYSLADLKTFINAFVTFIDADLAYEDAQNLLDS